MILTDTHTHLNSDGLDYPVDILIKRAGDQKVTRFFIPNIDKDTIEDVLDLGKTWPGICFPMLGLHPVHVAADFEEHLLAVEQALDKNKVYAIGEIGLDLFHDVTFQKQQEEAFIRQAEMASARALPMVIHCRNAFEELMNLLQPLEYLKLRGIFHCFTGTEEEAWRAIRAGFMLGIGGVLTYKNSGLAQAIQNIPLKHLVLETDSPYLSPVPNRGKRNESANIIYIAQKLADVKQISLERLADVTTENSKRVFGI